jgi:hypothetical protein
MELADLNKNFIYQSDKNLDNWKEMGLNKDGKYYGDCEDYCITVKKNVPDFKDWDYYYCKLNSVGHCVLIKNTDIIDCNCKKVLSIEHYTNLYNATNFKKYNQLVVFSKIMFSKILSIYEKIRGK